MALNQGAGAAAAMVPTGRNDTPFRILDLPSELLEQVFDAVVFHSWKYDLINIRRVSRTFRDHSDRAFGTAFFEHLIAILHPFSLSVLFEIAIHPRFSKFVRKVTISGECIGGGILMCEDAEEQQKHLQLYMSMERSGQGRLILDQVFRCLPGLVAVTIDSESYTMNGGEPDGARCGRRHIFGLDAKGNYLQSLEYDFESVERQKNQAIDVVLTSLRTISRTGQFKLQIHAVAAPPESLIRNTFDPNCAFWKDDFAPDVTELKLEERKVSEWSLNLLRSVKNLQTLEVYPSPCLRFSHPITGPFYWPRLRRLVLYMAVCEGDVITSFLEAHKDSLCDLELEDIDLNTGSWELPFQTVLKMPKLDTAVLAELRETTRPTHAVPSFDNIAHLLGIQNKPNRCMSVSGPSKIHTALGAVLHDFRTLDNRIDLSLQLYLVDFTMATAVIYDKAEIRDGQRYLRI